MASLASRLVMANCRLMDPSTLSLREGVYIITAPPLTILIFRPIILLLLHLSCRIVLSRRFAFLCPRDPILPILQEDVHQRRTEDGR